jgi:hypothetical protein
MNREVQWSLAVLRQWRDGLAPGEGRDMAGMVYEDHGAWWAGWHLSSDSTSRQLAAAIAKATGRPVTRDQRDRAMRDAAPAMLAALKKAEYSLAWHIEQQQRGVAMDAEHLRLIRAVIAIAEGAA